MKNILALLTRSALLVTALVFVFCGTAAALSPEQKKVIDSGPHYFNVQRACVVGNDSLSSDGVMSVYYPGFTDEAAIAASIDAFIRKSSPNSPWLDIPDFANRFVQEAKRLNVNPLLIVVIGRKESNFGVVGDSAIKGFNSFGNKGSNGYNGYRAWPSWEASLFGGDGLSGSADQSFTAATKYRLSGGHPNYVNVKNMYDYISVHLTGRILYPGDSARVYDEIMGEFVDLTNVVDYYNSAKEWIGEMTGQNIQVGVTGSASSCGSIGVVNGSIVETALSLAWTEKSKVDPIMEAVRATNGLCTMEDNPSACGTTKAAAGAFIRERDARPEYVNAVRQYNSGNDSDGANWAFSDCGVFAATVIRASGVDTDFPARGTGPFQLPYVQNSAAYETVLFTDTSQLQPGDILIKDGHVAIYVGPNQKTNAVVVQASWGQHVPIANQSTVTPGDGYYRARKLGV